MKMLRKILVGGIMFTVTSSSAVAQNSKAELARCLSQQGWVMYSSNVCSACTRQKRQFGQAYNLIREVECNPRARHSQSKRCMANEIYRTPTWILTVNGKEMQRLEGLQSLESLARASGCSRN